MKFMYFSPTLILLFVVCCKTSATNPELTNQIAFIYTVSCGEYVLGVAHNSPEFVAYDNGIVIYKPYYSSDDNDIFFITRLSESQKGVIFCNNANSFESSYSTYRNSGYTFPGCFYSFNWEQKSVFVYGNVQAKYVDDDIGLSDEISPVPIDLKEIDNLVDRIRKTKGTPWIPEKIEVIFRPSSRRNETPVFWPNGWPDLESNHTEILENGIYVLHPDSNLTNDIVSFAIATKNKTILINGGQFHVSIKFPLPGDNSGCNAF
jgi:hypothetical protein